MFKEKKPHQVMEEKQKSKTAEGGAAPAAKKKKTYTPFPPAQQPSKIDLQLESGEYFLSERERKAKKMAEKAKKSAEKTEEKRVKREMEFLPPSVLAAAQGTSSSESKPAKKDGNDNEKADVNRLVSKFAKSGKKRKPTFEDNTASFQSDSDPGVLFSSTKKEKKSKKAKK
mmetsp:Transcript_31024/g.63864  ORF Transcript_31024/g.63864 Transcript_31024/m.63864 type:complete len:171 (-) Transcript_31024:110-622(-)